MLWDEFNNTQSDEKPQEQEQRSEPGTGTDEAPFLRQTWT